MRSTDRSMTFTESARRTQIVDCAIDTVADLGYHHASIRKIAERVDVAMSVVLYHFGNKDDLVTAVVAELYRSLLRLMAPAVAAESTAAGKLAAHIRTHMSYIRSHRSHQLALMDIGSNYRSRNGERLHQMRVDLEPSEMSTMASAELESILTLGVRQGEFREFSVEAMATALRGAIGSAVLKTVVAADFDVIAYGEDLVTAFDLATRHP